MAVGERLKALRKERNISMRQLGEKIGMSHAYISQIESGERRCSLKTLEKIADFFSIDKSYFFHEEEDLKPFDFYERELLNSKKLKVNDIRARYNVTENDATDEEIQIAINLIEQIQKKTQGQ